MENKKLNNEISLELKSSWKRFFSSFISFLSKREKGTKTMGKSDCFDLRKYFRRWLNFLMTNCKNKSFLSLPRLELLFYKLCLTKERMTEIITTWGIIQVQSRFASGPVHRCGKKEQHRNAKGRSFCVRLRNKSLRQPSRGLKNRNEFLCHFFILGNNYVRHGAYSNSKRVWKAV